VWRKLDFHFPSSLSFVDIGRGRGYFPQVWPHTYAGVMLSFSPPRKWACPSEWKWEYRRSPFSPRSQHTFHPLASSKRRKRNAGRGERGESKRQKKGNKSGNANGKMGQIAAWRDSPPQQDAFLCTLILHFGRASRKRIPLSFQQPAKEGGREAGKALLRLIAVA